MTEVTEVTEVVASIRQLLLGEIAIDINDIFNVSFFFLVLFLFFNWFSTHLTVTSFSVWDIASEVRIGFIW